MRLVDVNILLNAINGKSPLYEAVRSWWEKAISGDEPVGLCWMVLVGFLRLATSARVFAQPLSIDQALGRAETWLAHPNVRLVRETDGHWRILKELLSQTGTAGNLTTDAHLAALAISHGATLASCDADFGRFPHLRWENPAAERSRFGP
jgi:toxin-antitoxin system PIN domain toxin